MYKEGGRHIWEITNTSVLLKPWVPEARGQAIKWERRFESGNASP